jgi:hypothetical protein
MVTPAVTADVVALNKSDLGEIRLGLTFNDKVHLFFNGKVFEKHSQEYFQ